MIAQYKLLRVLKLIGLLKSRSKSISQLADSLETTTRTIYRYLELLEEVGFIVDKDFHNRYFIHTEEQAQETEFTNEEAILVKELIQSGARGHPLQDTLLKKLYLNSDLKTISQNLLKARLGILVDRLGQAIREERLVVLRNYHSANSDQINDRKVEPIYLTPNFDAVVSLDQADQKNKHFKLERIGEVVLLDQPHKYQHLHQKIQTDIFGMTAEREIWVSLKMNLRAYLLMREEVPLSVPFLKKEGDTYSFYGPVGSFEGIARFVLGLLDSVEVVRPIEFKEYLQDRINDHQF